LAGEVRIMFIAANAGEGTFRRLQEEVREIDRSLRLSPEPDAFRLLTPWTVRVSDLQEYLFRHNPHVLHFSGRGSEAGGVVLAGDDGSPRPVSHEVLAELFHLLEGELRVAVFNDCYTVSQAHSLAEVFDYTIGMSSATQDETAVAFASAFYQALGYGYSVTEAFGLARNRLRLEGFPDYDTPFLLHREGVDLTRGLTDDGGAKPHADAASPVGLELVRRYAERAREGLEPHVLPRIERHVLRERYLESVMRGIKEERPRVIPLVGPAGYGKSTVLGSIYDELLRAEIGWLALARCNDLLLDGSNPSVEKLSVSLGEGVCGQTIPITDIAAALTEKHGRGVLLIDTLDIVLNKQLVPALRGTLLQLLDRGATVLFTCRDHEYRAFLEPPHDKLSGIGASIDRHEVLPFTPEEVEEAALSLSRSRHKSDGGAFARSILEASSDNRSLLDIVCHPLLLAMLCDLYAEEAAVPRDLTVSKLYEQYWEEKIVRSRKYGPDSQEAMLKRSLCLDAAEVVFDMSATRLHESVAESDLDLAASGTAGAAFAELFSEGVFKRLPAGRFRFFHQTFLEYALSRWLVTRAAASRKDALLDSLGDAGTAYAHLHWWPVVRQLLTVVDSDEFRQLVGRLDLNNLAAFRAVAYAAAAHDDPILLAELKARVVELGDAQQNTLLDAAAAAPASLAESSWEVAMSMLEHGSWRVAIKSAEAAGALLRRRGSVLGRRFAEALAAVERRTPVRDGADESSILCGWLLSALLRAGDSEVDVHVLRSLRARYMLLGESNRAGILRLHTLPGVSPKEQKELLLTAVSAPAAHKLKPELTTLLERLLPTLLASGETALGGSLTSALRVTLPDGWDVIQSKAVGRHLAGHPDAFGEVLRDLLVGDERRIFRNLTAIDEALKRGATDAFLHLLLQTPSREFGPRQAGIIGSLIRCIPHPLGPERQQQLIEWLDPLLRAHPDKLVSAFTLISTDSPTACELLVQLVMKLPERMRHEYVKRVLRDASPTVASLVVARLEAQLMSGPQSRAAQLAIVELLGVTAKDSPASATALVVMATRGGTHVARAASRALARAAGTADHISGESLLPLSGSRVVGVRLNWLKGLARMIERGSRLGEQDIIDACDALAGETSEPVLQGICDIIINWVRARGRATEAIGVAFGRLAVRSLEERLAGVGTLRTIIRALKVLAQSEEPGLRRRLGAWTRAVLRQTDLQRIKDGEAEMIDLLSAVARVDPTFLPETLDDCRQLPLRNVRAVVSAIKRVEGPGSHLLDRMLASQWCSPAVKSLILDIRGL